MSMSKIIKSSSEGEQVGFAHGYIFMDWSRDYITGRILTLLESFGLKDSQEKAAKDILRQEIESWFHREGTYLPDGLHTAVKNIMSRVEKEYQDKYKGQVPMSFAGYSYEISATEKEK